MKKSADTQFSRDLDVVKRAVDFEGKAKVLRPHFRIVERYRDRVPENYWCEVTVDPDGTEGLYWQDVIRNKDGEIEGPAAPQWISTPFYVVALTRNDQSSEWGRLTMLYDSAEKEHRSVVPQAIHAGSGEACRAWFLGEGGVLTTDPQLRRKLSDYIQQAKPEVIALCVEKTGWHAGDRFVLPRETYGDNETEPVVHQSSGSEESTLSQHGTLKGYLRNVSKPCIGNTRLVFALCVSFAAPCAGLLNIEGGGFHLMGRSSCGKSTAMCVAASTSGNPKNYVRSWRLTDNGLEGIAAAHSDLVLLLDEMGQLDEKFVGSIAYMLANGVGKSRSRRDGSPRPVLKWRCTFLSNGEPGLASMVAQSGGKVKAGQEVRIIDVPAVANDRLGIFEKLPDGVQPAIFSDTLRTESQKHYGHAIPAFLQKLTTDSDRVREQLRRFHEEATQRILPPDSSGQVRRVVSRFALVAAAGELATQYELTGWPPGEATNAAEACFNAWLESRGTTGNTEELAMISQVRCFLEENGEARFTRWDADGDGDRTVRKAGYRRQSMDGPLYYVEREVFRREICQGFEYRQVVQALKKVGALRLGSQGEATRVERLPDNRRTRVYVISPELWEGSAS